MCVNELSKSESGIISARESSRWRELLLSTETLDAYFLPEYVGFYERRGEGEALLFFYREGRKTVLYPFLRRPLPELPGIGRAAASHCDVSSAYGYGGPLVTSGVKDTGFTSRARACLEDHFQRMGVVSEFIRFHPILGNQAVWPTVPSRFDRNTVAIDLTLSTDGLWEHMDPSTRRNVRKSFRLDLSIELSRSPDRYEGFWRLYDQTMERVGATNYYRFSLDYINTLADCMGDKAIICTVSHRGKPAAAGIFLHAGRYLHYHLGGSDAALLHVRPNDRMFFEMAKWGISNGAESLHLGGGNGANDSLFKFKAGFSRDLRDFYVAKVVHDEELYATLMEARMRQSGKPPATRFFPAYRG